MVKVLIVIEDSVQAQAAVELLCARADVADCEVVLLSIRPFRRDWQRRGLPSTREAVQADAKERAAQSIAWQLLSRAGAYYKTRTAEGEFAATVIDVADSEGCNHIILSRPPETAFARKVFAITGLKIGGAIDHLVALATVPITVVGLHAKEPSAALLPS